MGVWTAYIAVGSYLKDERLAFFLGRTYREYQERVPGYPLIGFGPLGRRVPTSQESRVQSRGQEVESKEPLSGTRLSTLDSPSGPPDV
jgi:hypothetical protein